MSAPHPDWSRDGADWPNREASCFVRAGGVAWHVQRMGAGPIVLLLHGAGAAAHSWRDLMPALAARFDVVAPDLPGHGFSRAPGNAAASLPGMARAVAALLEAEDIRPALIVGHSAGAAVALRLALDGAAPKAIVGLSAALAPFRGIAGLLFPRMARALALNPFTPWMFSRIAGGQVQARRLVEATGSRLDARGHALYARLFGRPDHVSGALSMMARWDVGPLAETIGALPMPIHLVVGLDDRTVPPGDARDIAARHDGIRLHEFPGAGHLLHEERPNDIAALIGRIAEAVSATPRRKSPEGRTGAA